MIAASTPRAPKSFTIIPNLLSGKSFTILFRKVVLPAPRKPEIKINGIEPDTLSPAPLSAGRNNAAVFQAASDE
jgi:hypothetical protein